MAAPKMSEFESSPRTAAHLTKQKNNARDTMSQTVNANKQSSEPALSVFDVTRDAAAAPLGTRLYWMSHLKPEERTHDKTPTKSNFARAVVALYSDS